MADFFIVRMTEAEWTAANPVLLDNQLGVISDIRNNAETESNFAKLGNGIDTWSELPYWNPTGGASDVFGPDTSVVGNIATWDNTTGSLIADSGVSIDSLPPWTPAAEGNAASLDFAEDADNGTHAVTLKAPDSVTADVEVELPDAAGTLALTDDIPDIPFTAASASSAASLDFAEDTDNGAHVTTLKGAAALAGDIEVVLPSEAGTLALQTAKRYTAVLTQSGTDAPVAAVVENTLGGTLVWTRSGPGDYRGTLAGAFTNTTFLNMQNLEWDGLTGNFLQPFSANEVRLLIAAGDDFLAPGSEANVEIIVAL